MKRRVFTMKFLAPLFILMFWGHTTYAQCDNSSASFTIEFSQSTFYVTETFYADVILNDGECVQGAAVSIDFDDTKLSMVSVSTVDVVDGGLFPNPQMLSPAAPPGVISRDITNLGSAVGSSLFPATGAVMRIEFEVIDEGFNDIEFVVGTSGDHPSIAENDGGVFTFYNNVTAFDETIENLPEVLCDNSMAEFTMDLSHLFIGEGDTFNAELHLADAQCVQGVSLTIEYDDALLSVNGFSGIDQVDGGMFENPMVTDDGSFPGQLNVTIGGDNTPYGQDLIFVSGSVLSIDFDVLDGGMASIDYAAGPTGFNPRIDQLKGNVQSYVNNVSATGATIELIPLMVVNRLFDDFNDNDFTNNPTWYTTQEMGTDAFNTTFVSAGNYAVCNNGSVQTGTLMTHSSISNHWKIAVFHDYDAPATTGLILQSDKLIQEVDDAFTGYYFEIEDNGDGVLYRKDGMTGTGTSLGSAVSITSGQSVQIVRTEQSVFHVFASTDTDFTVTNWSSIDYLGTFVDTDPGIFASNFTGLYFNDIGTGDVCFDNVDYGIPATILTGTAGETNVNLLSSPVENTTYGDLFSTVWTQGFTGSDMVGVTSNMYVFDETIVPRNPVLNGSYLPPNSATNRVGTRSDAQSSAGKGVLAYIFDEQGYQGVYSGWPKVLEFDGTPNSGDIDVPLSVTFSGDYGSYDSYEDGWHIAGNPYMRSIMAEDLLNNSQDMHQAVYVWDQNRNGGQGDYRFYVANTGGTLPDGLIAPFQGFWVKANDPVDAELRFEESQQVSGDGARLYGSDTVQSIVFSAREGEIESTMFVAFNPASELGTDVFDAFKLNNANEQFISLFTRNNDGHPLVVNSVPDNLQEELRIPVYLNSNFASTVELSWNGLDAFDSSWSFELRDIKTGKVYDLRQEGGSLFISPNMLERDAQDAGLGAPVDSEQGDARFILMVNNSETEGSVDLPEQVALNQNYPNPFNPTTQIQFEIPSEADVTLEVFDVMGRKVSTLINQSMSAGQHTITWNAADVSSGVYIYRLQAGSVALTRKMTLIK